MTDGERASSGRTLSRSETNRNNFETRAMFAEAEAIKSLAGAELGKEREESVLDGLIGRLSERTQYAVQRQLRR